MLWVEHREPLNDGMAQKQYSNHSKHRNPNVPPSSSSTHPAAWTGKIFKRWLCSLFQCRTPILISPFETNRLKFSYKHLFYQNRICINNNPCNSKLHLKGIQPLQLLFTSHFRQPQFSISNSLHPNSRWPKSHLDRCLMLSFQIGIVDLWRSSW